MADEDRLRWDARYAVGGEDGASLPEVFAAYAEEFPKTGRALDVACGRGTAAVWLAARGLSVVGLDISPVALARARGLAAATGVAGRCRFEAVDLDDGLPAGPPVDVIICHMYRDSRLDGSLVERLVRGGLLAVAARSEVGAGPGSFRAAAGELAAAFASLDVIAQGEGEGRAWFLGRKRAC